MTLVADEKSAKPTAGVEVRAGRDVLPSPRVSVVIPAYKVAPFVAETLDSIFAQSYVDFEVVIVNDGSPDTEAFEEVVAPYLERLVYAKQPNQGASQARNTAIGLARGELIAFLDGDDLWEPDYLLSQIALFDAGELDMVYADAVLFGDSVPSGRTFMGMSPSNGPVTTCSLIASECNVITSGTVLRRSVAIEAGLFDTSLAGMEDFDLWYRIAKSGARIGYQKNALVRYRVRNDSLSGTNVERAARSIHAMNVIRNKYGLTEQEQPVWERRVSLYEANLELERGKAAMVAGDFDLARDSLTKANAVFGKTKLTVIGALLRFSPRLALVLFRKFRSEEFSFIADRR